MHVVGSAQCIEFALELGTIVAAYYLGGAKGAEQSFLEALCDGGAAAISDGEEDTVLGEAADRCEYV